MARVQQVETAAGRHHRAARSAHPGDHRQRVGRFGGRSCGRGTRRPGGRAACRGAA
ncbi:hypothetical protein [Streptomyces sp. NPDC060031]|uniref:hypothetical protein n=1 Tax=Streptomyces sp. NPDC060031 TaxID=3347043 RepID=UPI00367BE434